MPAYYEYTHATGSNVDVSERVRAYRTELKSNAEEGSVAISTLIIDDPEGGLDIKGLRPFTWRETSESSNSSIIYKGYTADRKLTRGPFRNGVGRIWTVNMTDQNAIINRRIMRGADANRPAETDVARVQWLMTTGEFGNVVADSSYISTASPVAMDAVDYRNQRCQDILDDCAQQSGKNFFIILNELFNPAPYSLFYDFAHSTAYASTIRLTNNLAEVDNPVTSTSSTFAVIDERTNLNRDPSRVYAGIVLPFDGGEVFVYDPAIASAFHPRDTMAPSVNVKTAAKATVRANRYLADAATEADIIETAFLVPLAKVNRLKEGMTFQFKATHLPGYTDWTWLRVLNRTVIATSEEFYTVVLEASPAAGSPAAASCAAIVGSMQTDDTGQQGNLNPTFTNDFGWTPDNPSQYPCTVVASIMAQRGDDLMGGDPSVLGTFTELSSHPDSGAAQANVSAYKHVASGSPGSMAVRITPTATSGVERWRGMAVYLPTSATAPVHKGEQNINGATLVLDGTPTVGNILVLTRYANVSGFATVPTGFTQLVTGTFTTSAIGLFQMDICVRCVQEGDTATFTVSNHSQPHWQFMSEWALT